MIRSEQLDRSFPQEIMAEPGGEDLFTCSACGTCAATCLVRRFDPSFNPRIILHKAVLGLRDEVLSSAEIWECSACDACYERCPKGIHISEVMKAIRNIAIREGYTPPKPSAQVDQDICSGCAVCTRACPYEAVERITISVDGQERHVASVDETLCLRCGLCVAACPTGAMSLDQVNQREIVTRMGADGWLDMPSYRDGGAAPPRLLAFVCQWSIHSDLEWSRLTQLESDTLRIVTLPCSGRIDPALVLMALTRGADGVLLVGCQEGECHYTRGTFLGRSKLALLEQILAQMSIAKERVHFAEVASTDRQVLPRLVEEMRKSLKDAMSGPHRVPAATERGAK